MSQPTFLLNATGTMGDLVPLISTAVALRRLGASCHVLASEAARGMAETHRVHFTSVAPTQVNNLTPIEESFGNIVFPSYAPTCRVVEEYLRGGRPVVVLNLSPVSPTTLLAERYNLPLLRLELSPYRLPSLISPHWPWLKELTGEEAQPLRTKQLAQRYRQRYEHPYIVSRLNEFRTALGLPTVRSTLPLQRLIRHRVAFFPEWFAPPPQDWPDAMTFVGFPFLPSTTRLPKHLLRWLQSHRQPLVFTPGTGVTEVAHFFAVAEETCRRLNRPGVFLSPHVDRGILRRTTDILPLDRVDLGRLLPFASLLVHHGGIGTTAQALRAGVPQIISPQAYDQPDNGYRVVQLGVGSMIARPLLSPESLTSVARPLLFSEPVAANLRVVARRLQSTDAGELAARTLMAALANSNKPSAGMEKTCRKVA